MSTFAQFVNEALQNNALVANRAARQTTQLHSRLGELKPPTGSKMHGVCFKTMSGSKYFVYRWDSNSLFVAVRKSDGSKRAPARLLDITCNHWDCLRMETPRTIRTTTPVETAVMQWADYKLPA